MTGKNTGIRAKKTGSTPEKDLKSLEKNTGIRSEIPEKTTGIRSKMTEKNTGLRSKNTEKSQV